MNRNKPKDEPNSIEDVFQKAFGEMCSALDRFGPGEILNILTENSHNDTICLNLLTRFPTVVSLSEFLYTLPIVKVNKRMLKRLEKRGLI
jgi:hypothetical protein